MVPIKKGYFTLGELNRSEIDISDIDDCWEDISQESLLEFIHKDKNDK